MYFLKISEPDCYETPDVPLPTGILRDTRQFDGPETSEEIDNSSLSSSDLFKTFAGKKFDTSKQSKFFKFFFVF